MLLSEPRPIVGRGLSFWFLVMREFITGIVLVTLALVVEANPIYPVNSDSEIEVRLASVIRSQLNFNPRLETVDGAEDNLRLVNFFEENASEFNTPKIATFIETRILSKSEGEVTAQVISIFSTANISIEPNKYLSLLEWANQWNNQFFPIRMQVGKNNLLMASSNLLVTTDLPVEEARVLHSFISVSQIWVKAIESLKVSNLLK